MTGEQVRALRVALKMEPAHFAQLLGVHPSTLYRWEAAGLALVRVEPFQQQILAVLQQQLQARSPQSDLGSTILKGLLVGGSMFGLFKLLEAAFSDTNQRRTEGAVDRPTSARKRSSSRRKGRS